MSVRILLSACALASAFAAAPALAQDAGYAAPPPAAAAPADPYGPHRAAFDRARDSWIGECRRRYVATYAERREGPGLAGLLIGGLLGGAAGYGIAGAGDRAIGTVAGAVLGGAVGGALDKGGRKGRNAALLDEAEDYCISYFDYQMAVAQQPGYAQAHAYPVMMVPVAAPTPVATAQPAPAPRCREEVTYEDVEVPVRTRSIPPRAKPRAAPRDKRLRMD